MKVGKVIFGNLKVVGIVVVVILVAVLGYMGAKAKAAADRANAVHSVVQVMGPQLTKLGFRPITGQSLDKNDPYTMNDNLTQGAVIVNMTGSTSGEVDVKLTNGVWWIGCMKGNFIPFNKLHPTAPSTEAIEAFEATMGCAKLAS